MASPGVATVPDGRDVVDDAGGGHGRAAGTQRVGGKVGLAQLAPAAGVVDGGMEGVAVHQVSRLHHHVDALAPSGQWGLPVLRSCRACAPAAPPAAIVCARCWACLAWRSA